jgi:hypothetical protein
MVGDTEVLCHDPIGLRWPKTYRAGSRGEAMGTSSSITGFSQTYQPIGGGGSPRVYRLKTTPTASLKGTAPNRYGRWTDGDMETLIATYTAPSLDVFGCPIAIPCGTLPTNAQWGFVVQPTHICSGLGYISSDYSTNIHSNAVLCVDRIQQTNDTYTQNINGGPVDNRWIPMSNNGTGVYNLLMKQSDGGIYLFDRIGSSNIRSINLSGTFNLYISTANSAIADPVVNLLFQCSTIGGIITASSVSTTKTVEIAGEGTNANVSALKYTCTYDFSGVSLPPGTISYYLAFSYTNGSKINRAGSYCNGANISASSLPASPVAISNLISTPPPPCFTSDMLPGSVAMPGMLWRVPV